MRSTILAAIFSGAMLLASSASADVHITITNGQVTLSAKDATVRQILAEWARVGQTTFVNAERIAGGTMTLELANVSEEQALDVVLRSVSGYLAAPRSSSIANASRYDRILVVPTSTGTRPTAAPPATFQQPQFNPPPIDDADDGDDEPRPGAAPNAPNGAPVRRGPIFNAFPPNQGAPRQQAPAPAPAQVQPQTPPGTGTFTMPQMPAGVSVPGMIVPAPAPQPGQATAPGAVQETP